MTADEAEARSLQREPDGHRPLVAQQAEDAGTNAGDGEVADVPAEGAVVTAPLLCILTRLLLLLLLLVFFSCCSVRLL